MRQQAQSIQHPAHAANMRLRVKARWQQRLPRHSEGVQGNAAASPDAFSILPMSNLCACMSKHASQLGWHDALECVQGIATSSPDAFSILRMSKKLRLHVDACSQLGWHDTLRRVQSFESFASASPMHSRSCTYNEYALACRGTQTAKAATTT